MVFLFYTERLTGSCASMPDTSIPTDSIGISDTILNTGSTGLLGVDVFLEEVCLLIDHNYIGNLEVILTSPEGTQITIFNGEAISDELPNYAITDHLGSPSSQTPVCFAPEVIIDPYIYWADTNNHDSFYGSATGNWQPFDSFDIFSGEDPNGDWSLTVSEDTTISNYDGMFLSWSIGFSNGDCLEGLGLDEFNQVEATLSLDGLGESYCAYDSAVTLYPSAITNSYWPEETSEEYVFVNSTALDMPDTSQVSSTIQVGSFPENAILLNADDIAVTFEIDHSWVGDLSITLVSPCGVNIPLIDRPGFPIYYNPHGSGSGVIGEYTFSIDAEEYFPQTQIADTIPPGEYWPKLSFEELLGCSLNGDWSIVVLDSGNGDVGVINNWMIDLAFNIPEGNDLLVGNGVMTDTSQIIFDPSMADIGENEIIYIYEFTNGQVFTDTFITTVNAVPVLEEIDSLMLCNGEGLNLDEVIPLEVNGLSGTYQWYSDFTLTQAINPNVTSAGDYYLKFITNEGCETSAVFNLEIAGVQYPTVSNTGPYCEGEVIQLNSTTVMEGEEVAYIWSGPDFFSTDENPEIDPELAVEGEYTLTVIIDGCEMPIASTEVVINELPTLALLDTIQDVCSTEPIQTYYLSQTYDSHNWTIENGILYDGGYPNDPFAMINWTGPSPGIISVEVTNGNNCVSEVVTWEVPYYDLPEPDFLTASTVVCSGETQVLYQLNANYTNIVWEIENGVVETEASNYILVDWDSVDSTTQGNISATLSNEIDCSTVFSQAVSIYPYPEPLIIDFDTTVCADDEITYTLNSDYESYEWNISGGTVIEGGTDTDSFIIVHWNDESIGTIEVEVEQNTCSSIFQDSIIINNISIPTFEATDSTLCLGSEGILYTLEETYNEHTWTVNGGEIVNGGTIDDNFVQINWTEEGAILGELNVIVSNEHGCVDTTDLNIVINPLPTITLIDPDTMVCFDETVQYTLETNSQQEQYIWEIEGGTLLDDSSLPAHEAMIVWDDSPGISAINLTILDDKGCSFTKTFSVQVNEIPEPNFANPTDVVCVSNNEITYALNQNWDYQEFVLTDGVLIDSSANEITVQWLEAGTGNIEATVVDEYGCTASVAIEIDIEQESSVAFLNPDINLCSGNEVVEYAIPTGYTISDYYIDNGDFLSNTNSTITVEWQVGEGALFLTTETPSGCTVLSDSLAVSLINIETPVFAQASEQVCEESIAIEYSIDQSYLNYEWNIEGGIIVGDGNPNDSTILVDWGTNGMGSLSLTVEILGDCTTSIELPVEINALPNPVFDNPMLEVCAESQNVAYSLEETYQMYEWIVTGGEIIGDSTAANIAINWFDGTVGSIEVIVTDNNDCQQSIAENIQINALPEIVWTQQPTTICEDFGEVTYEINNPNLANYDWNITNGTITAGDGTNQINVQWDNTQNNHSIVLMVSNENACSFSESFSVDLIQDPDLVFETASPTHCETEGAVLYQLSDGFTDFIWDIQGGNSIDGGNNNSDFALIEWTGPGMKNINVLASNDFGCSAEQDFAVEVKPEIQALTNQSYFPICVGDTVSFLALGGDYYEWSPAVSLMESDVPNPMATPQESTLYQVIVGQNNGCVDTAFVNVEIMPETELAVISDPYEYCGIEALTVEADSAHIDNFSWSSNVPGIWQQDNTLSPIFTPDDKEDEIVLTITGEGFCGPTIDSVVFKAQDNPIDIALEEDLLEICQGDFVDLSTLVDAPDEASISWSGGNGVFESPTSANTVYNTLPSDEGMFDLTIRVESDCHSKEDVVNLMVYPNGILSAGEDQTVYVGESVQLFAEGDPFRNYIWTPSEGLSCTSCQNPIASPTETITYKLISTTICTNEASVTVLVDKSTKVAVPTAFSPNYDGMNDYFKPSGRGYELIEMSIYNRYGQQVFRMTDASQGWDGSYNGEPQPVGVYTYIFEYETYETKLRKIKKGNVTLIK